MIILYRINQIVFLITIALYTTIFLGLYAQILLGIVQVLSALYLLLIWDELPSKTKKCLKQYWIIVAIYGLLWLINWHVFNETFIIIFGVIILPLAIAGYFLYILDTFVSKDMTKKPTL